MLQIKKETANLSHYNVGNNANNANFVHLWKIWLVHEVSANEVNAILKLSTSRADSVG